jgi:hypothetical protein
MKLTAIGTRRLLQISTALVIIGLLLEMVSLLWFHPLSFVLFAFVAAALIGLGILVYLASLVLTVAPSAPGAAADGPLRLRSLMVRDQHHHAVSAEAFGRDLARAARNAI